jgi:WD40 repeat protein
VKIQLSPDLEKVLLVESDRRAYLRDAVPMLLGVLDQASRPLYSPDGGLAAAQLSRDGRVLATADTLVRLWQSDVEEVTPPSEFGPLKGSVKRSRGDDLVVLQGERSFTLRGQEGRSASDPVFSPVGDRVLIEVDDSVGLWGADGNRVARLPGHSVFCLMDASFSPDGNYFLTSCSHDKQPRRWLLWDRNGRLVNDGLPLGHWEPDFSGTSDRVIAIHPNQSSILIVDLQGKLTARIDPSWRWQESEHGIHAIRAPTSGNHFLAVLAEGRRQVDADSSVRFSGNYKVRIYDLDGKKRFAFDFEEATFAADEDPGSPVASYSPTNDRILVAGLTGDVLLADIDGREISLLKEHAGPVADAAFSPAGDRIATVGVDGSVRLWTTHGELRALVTATEGKAPVQFTRDGKTLRTDGGNFWAVYGPDLLALADERITRDFTAEERRRYAELLGESGE